MTISMTVYDGNNIKSYWASDGTVGIMSIDDDGFVSTDRSVGLKLSEIKLALDHPDMGEIYRVTEERPCMFYQESDVIITTKDDYVIFEENTSFEQNGIRMPSKVIVSLETLQVIFDEACKQRDYFMEEIRIPPVLGTNCLKEEQDVR